MKDYGAIHPQFWTGETGRILRESGVEVQLLACYLMTNAHRNALGLYYLPKVLISHETALTPEGASKGLRRAFEGGFAAYDDPSEVVWVYEMAHYQIADKLSPNDNRVKWVNKKYNELPNNPFLLDFYEKYGDALCLKNKREPKGASKGLQRGFEGPSKPDSDSDSDTDAFTNVKANVPSGHYSAIVGEYLKQIDDLCESIVKIPKSKTQKFNPNEFVQKATNKRAHPLAIIDALSSVKKDYQTIGKFWAYANTVLKTRSQNYREKEHMKEADEFKKLLSVPGPIEEIIKNALKGIE